MPFPQRHGLAPADLKGGATFKLADSRTSALIAFEGIIVFPSVRLSGLG